jgi:hypothetical protein
MAIAYRSGSTAGNSSGGNLTITKPADTADGDILIAVCYNEISASAWTAPAGWAQWGTGQVNGGANAWINVYWKRASSEGANYTFNISTTWRVIAMGAFSGAIASGDPIDVGPTGDNVGGVANDIVRYLSITTATANSMRIGLEGNYAGGNDSAGTSGFAAGAHLGGCEIWYVLQAAAGASGDKIMGTNIGDNYWSSYHLAIKPATEGATNITAAQNFQAQVSDAPTIRAYYPIAPAQNFQAQVSDAGNVTYINPTYNITVAQANQAQVSDACGITAQAPTYNITPSQNFQAQVSDAAILGVYTPIAPAQNFQAQVSDAATLGVYTPIAPDQNYQAQVSDACGITAQAPTYNITPAEDNQSQVSDAAIIGVFVSITGADNNQAQVSDACGITSQAPTFNITPSDAAQAQVSDTANVSLPSLNHAVDVGNGYSDGSMQQLLRTSTNYIYIPSWKFDNYPQGATTGLGETLRMYKADQAGIPSTFSRLDTSNEPLNATQWAAAIDGNDLIHVLWMERAAWTPPGSIDNLKYCTFSTALGTWGSVTTIDNALNMDDENGQGDEMCAIAIDASNVAHIVYLKYEAGEGVRRVYYRNNSSGWSSATLIDDQSLSGGEKCHHPGIAFDTSGNIVVTWVRGSDEGSSDGRAFVRVYSGSWGTTHDITGADIWPGIDACLRLYIDRNNWFHIATLSATKKIQYWYSDDSGETWTANHPGGGTAVGDDPVVGPFANNNVRLYAHNDPATDTKITYWQAAGGSADWGTRTVYNATTGMDCTVNVRWSQYHNYYPSTYDIAYWKSSYPTNELYIGSDITAVDITGAQDNQAQVSDAAVLSISEIGITPAQANQAQVSDAAILSAGETVITPAQANQAQVSDAAVFGVIHPVAVVQANQAQVSDAASISFSGISVVNITVADGTQAQVSDAAIIGVYTPIAPAQNYQAQASDAAIITANGPVYTITIADATQAQVSDPVTFGVIYPIAMVDNYQAQVSDSASLAIGGIINHGERRLYELNTRSNSVFSTRPTHETATREDLEVDD